MSQPLTEQANQLWKTVSEPDTAQTYKSTFAITWKILKDLVHLVWLTLCSVIVIVDWLSRTSTRLFNWIKKTIHSLQNQSPEDLAFNTKQALLSASQGVLRNTVANARKELGLAEQAIAPKLSQAVESEAVSASQVKVKIQETTAEQVAS